MPSSPIELFRSGGYQLTGSVPWGIRPRSSRPGVYVVSLSTDATVGSGQAECPLASAEIQRWLERLPDFRLAGEPTSDVGAVARHLAEWWLPDETIVYIGKATNLTSRVGQYYRTPLGDPKPHAGGHWIKTLSVLQQLTVHYVEVPNASPEAVEDNLLSLFMSGVSPETRARHPQPTLPLPFANLEGPGGRRAHSLRGTRLRG